MTIYRARIEFLPSYHIMYKNKNNIHDRFVSAQPHSLQLSGGKNDLFSPSPLRGSGRKCHFCLPQAEVNSVVPQQNGRKRCIVARFSSFFLAFSDPNISKILRKPHPNPNFGILIIIIYLSL